MPEAVQCASEALLSIFNDVVAKEAMARAAEILDIRAICTTDKHHAIRPS